MTLLGKRVDQRGVSAGGDVAGGNIHKQTYIIDGQHRTNLWEACNKLKLGLNNDCKKLEFIARITEFMAGAEDLPSGGFRSLEEKLSAGGMAQRTRRATRLKERFVKKLTQSAFNELLQDVYALILVEIDSGFEYKVRPLLQGNNQGQIDAATFKIYETIESQLHGITDISKDDLEGMLYYLAGNCYINWDHS